MKKAEGSYAEGRRQKGKLLMDSQRPAAPRLLTPNNFEHPVDDGVLNP
ncbi:MAG: hypothetical protein SWX82_12305 [Cyanobacteriota bacterium]|nr:hypothetical protein [Cyanobacteriota bacterium]